MGKEFLEDLWYLWCVSLLHNYPIIFPTTKMSSFLNLSRNKNLLLWEFLSWYQLVSLWKKELEQELERIKLPEKKYEYVTVAIIHRPYFKNPNTRML